MTSISHEVSESPATLTILIFFFNDPATPEIYTLSLHDALPICVQGGLEPCSHYSIHALVIGPMYAARSHARARPSTRSEEHTSELQSRRDLVCRLLLEKKKKKT